MATYTSAHTGAEIDLAVGNANLMLLTGAADPDITTVGTLGQLYQNTTDGTLFRCSAVGATYTWVELADYSPTTAVNTLTETAAGKVLDARQGKTLSDKIGAQTFTEDNYVTDGQSATASIDALDQAVKDNADLISTNCDVAIPNLILNSGFASTNDWTLTASAGIADGKLTLTAVSGSNIQAMQTLAASINAHKMYVRCKVDANTLNGAFRIGGTGSTGLFNTNPIEYTAGQTGIKTAVATSRATGTANLIQIYTSSLASSGAVVVDYVLISDLTAIFGAGNEPTASEMDFLVGLVPNNWWDGTLLPAQKLLLNWQLKMIRANTAAIAAL